MDARPRRPWAAWSARARTHPRQRLRARASSLQGTLASRSVVFMERLNLAPPEVELSLAGVARFPPELLR